MRLFCLPFAPVELYEPVPGWAVVVTPAWELEVVGLVGRGRVQPVGDGSDFGRHTAKKVLAQARRRASQRRMARM